MTEIKDGDVVDAKRVQQIFVALQRSLDESHTPGRDTILRTDSNLILTSASQLLANARPERIDAVELRRRVEKLDHTKEFGVDTFCRGYARAKRKVLAIIDDMMTGD